MNEVDPSHLPTVGIVVPCRNEVRFVGPCLESLLANNYPRALTEILVVDGCSEDGSREVILGIASRDDRVRLLDNAKGIIPAAMNIGITSTSADVILKADAHSTYPSDYVRTCVDHLLASGADNVGGVIETVPTEPTLVGRAIAMTLASRFGSGNSRFRIASGGAPEWADSAAFGCYRADVFTRIGLYDERLVRSSDMEFNSRLRRAGGKILLVPDIVATYSARSRLPDFFARNLVDGFWALYPMRFGKGSVRFRHAVPAICLVAFIVGVALAPLTLLAPAAAGTAVALYAALNLTISIRKAAKQRSGGLAVVLPLVFVVRHLAYALGSLVGMIRAVGSRDFLKSRGASSRPG